MKQTLQRKFILTAMGPVTALLLVLLLAINLVNWYQVHQQTDRMLQMVVQQEAFPLPPPEPGGPQPMPGWREVMPPEFQEEIREVAWHRVLSMLALSTGGVALCWLGMLALVRVLARRSIEPVAEGIAKQKQFITNAGHELKTPLAIIRANTEAMELHQGENKWTRNIKDQILRLSGLTENLLILARMEESGLPAPEPVDLSALSLAAVESFREAGAQKTIRLEEHIAPRVTIQANGAHILQLLSILLDNGVKYTEAGGRIRLTLTGGGDRACLTVENSPAKLDGADLSRLFDRFYRGDPARTGGGYGIGLSAAQTIVQGWKGTIEARAEGETAVFTVRF